MRQLLVGSVDGHGLAAVFDPEGPDAGRFRRLRDVAGSDAGPGQRMLIRLEGEVFNLAELSRELELPEASSAEEVLAAGAERWWRDLLPRLRGSFVLAVVDRRDPRALVAADQGAGHSVYLRRDGRRLLLASEIHLLLGLLPTRPGPDPVGVVHWFSDYPAPAGRTLFEGVEELPGGECIELSPSEWRTLPYWRPHYEPPDEDMSADEAAELLWTALVSGVGRRIGIGDEVGIVMSAGVDSAAVAAAAVAAGGGRPLHGYSVVFPGHPDDRVDETERIDALTAALHLDGTQVRLEPVGSFASSLEWLRAWEVPLGGPGYLLERALLSVAADAGITAVLDGQGGDEGFAVSPFWLTDLLRQGRLAASLRAARQLPGAGASRRDALEAWYEHAWLGAIPARVHEAWRRHVRPTRHAPTFLRPEPARLHVETDDVWAWKRRHGVPAWWAEREFLLTADRQAVGVGAYLRRRAALAGVKARPPLLDPDLIDSLLRIPPHFGLDPVYDRVLIRRALAGRVPDSVRLWTRKSHLGPFFFDVVAGADLPAIRQVLERPRLEVEAFAERRAVQGMLDDVPAAADPGRLGWMIDVWRLVTAECWLRFQEDASLPDSLLEAGLPGPSWSIHARRAPGS